MWTYNYNYNNEELKHYGVIGMKWGVRRARKKGTDYKYVSRATKKYGKKASIAKESAREWDEMAKYAKQKGKIKRANKFAANAQKDRADAAEMARRQKRSSELDAKMEKNIRNTSRGKTAAKVLVNGFFGTKTYEVAKAAGYGRGGAFIASRIANYVGGPLGNMAANALIRSDYVKRRD